MFLDFVLWNYPNWSGQQSVFCLAKHQFQLEAKAAFFIGGRKQLTVMNGSLFCFLINYYYLFHTSGSESLIKYHGSIFTQEEEAKKVQDIKIQHNSTGDITIKTYRELT